MRHHCRVNSPDPRIARTVSAYEEFAQSYADATRSYDAFPSLWDETARFIAAVPPEETVLDVGCGAGRDSIRFANFGRRVIALDASPAMLHSWDLSAAVDGVIAKVRANLEAIPIRNASMGGVWACASVLHLPGENLAENVRSLAATLVPGGAIAISMKGTGDSGWIVDGPIREARWQEIVDPEDMTRMLAAAGLEEVAWHYTGGPWYVASASAPGLAPQVVE